jgi:Sec-independent protein translocase protein TatA
MNKIVRTCVVVTGLLVSLSVKAQLHSHLRTDGVEFIGAKSMELSQGEDLKPMLQELGLYLEDFKQELSQKTSEFSEIQKKSKQYYKLKNEQAEDSSEELKNLESNLQASGFDVSKIAEDKFDDVVKAKVSTQMWKNSGETSRNRMTKGWHIVNNHKSYASVESEPKDHLGIKPLVARDRK